MKKITSRVLMIILGLSMLVSCGGGSSTSSSETEFAILQDSKFEGRFYPSLAVWNASQEDPSDLFYSFYLVPPKKGAVIRITIEESDLNEKTIIQEKAESTDEMEIFPIIKWKYEKLTQLAQSGTTTMTCILEIDGEEVDRINHVIKYTPINDCVFAMYDDEEGEWVSLKEMFALYVNEDYPEIDGVLQEILAKDRSRQFIDYQGSFQDVINQIYWVWEYFSEKGTRYSNITNTSTDLEKIGSQNMRFIDQALNNNQANCVDGSALLASIYSKIGLDCYLVFVPGHCKLAIGIDMEADIDRDGYIDYPDGGYIVIETTLMGSVTSPIDSYMSANVFYDYDGLENMIVQEDAYFVNIKEARASGIMPIKR